MEPQLTIRQMRAINAVATHLSLARAADHLNASQSSLSRHIADAERKLGQKFFQRGWTGMEPTSAGEIVIASCRRMIVAIEAFQAQLKTQGARSADLTHHLNWELLSAADAVRKTAGVSAAADYLQLSQPAVSRAIAKLSAALGRPAFRRTRAGMVPNGELPRELGDLRAALVVEAHALPSRLASLSTEMTGRVSVGLLPFSEQAIVMKTFGEILRRHRHVRLHAVTGPYPALIEALQRDEVDFIIGPLRDAPPSEALQQTRIWSEFFAIVGREEHPLMRGAKRLGDLIDANWLVAPHGTPTRAYFEALMLSQGLTPPPQTCEIVTFSLAEQLALESDAIALLTYSPRRRAELRPGLSLAPIVLLQDERAVGLTFRRRVPLSPAQKLFVEIMTTEAEAAMS